MERKESLSAYKAVTTYIRGDDPEGGDRIRDMSCFHYSEITAHPGGLAVYSSTFGGFWNSRMTISKDGLAYAQRWTPIIPCLSKMKVYVNNVFKPFQMPFVRSQAGMKHIAKFMSSDGEKGEQFGTFGCSSSQYMSAYQGGLTMKWMKKQYGCTYLTNEVFLPATSMAGLHRQYSNIGASPLIVLELVLLVVGIMLKADDEYAETDVPTVLFAFAGVVFVVILVLLYGQSVAVKMYSKGMARPYTVSMHKLKSKNAFTTAVEKLEKVD